MCNQQINLKKNNSPESNLSITHACMAVWCCSVWRWGALVTIDNHQRSLYNKVSYTQKCRGWKMDPTIHQTIQRWQRIKKGWVLVLAASASLWKKTIATLLNDRPIYWHYAKNMFSPVRNKYEANFSPQNHSFQKKQPKSIQIFCLAWCSKVCNWKAC